MRLPFSKVYRAFPQLNQFSDSECDRFCGHICRQEKLRYVAPAVFVMLLAIAAPVAIILLEPERVVLALTICATAALAVAIRTRRRALHQALEERISSPRCEMCSFSLIGLPVKDGLTRCPECGNRTVLAEHLLTPEDLLAQPATAGSADHQEDRN